MSGFWNLKIWGEATHSFRLGEEILNQGEASVLAFFWVKLGGEEAPALNGRSESLPVARAGGGDGIVFGLRIIGVDKIEILLVF